MIHWWLKLFTIDSRKIQSTHVPFWNYYPSILSLFAIFYIFCSAIYFYLEKWTIWWKTKINLTILAIFFFLCYQTIKSRSLPHLMFFIWSFESKSKQFYCSNNLKKLFYEITTCNPWSRFYSVNNAKGKSFTDKK